MKRYVIGVAMVALGVSPALAAKFTMQLNPAGEQTGRMFSGVGAVDDHRPGSSVRLVQAEGDLKKRGVIQLIVMNHSDKPINFGPENVTAKLGDGTEVTIITYERLVKEEKNRQMWSAIGAGLAAAGNSMSAANSGYYSGRATYSGSTYGSFGSTPYNSQTTGMASISGYNAGQAQLAQSLANQQNQANFARMADQNASNLEALKTYMRTTTVDPQQMFGGSVTFQLPKTVHQQKADVPITFVISINGENHTFNGILKRR